MKSCLGTLENEPNCGRPLGLRLDSEKYLVVLDAYKGMFRVNPVTGRETGTRFRVLIMVELRFAE